jgi:hypothetical protein
VPVPEFKLQCSPKDIASLASRFSYDKSDAMCQQVGKEARNRGHYTRDEFLTVCAWKTDRSRSKVQANDASSVERLTARALSARDETTRMEALLELDGVGVPTASALLLFAFPDDYPILDVRALESLGHPGRTTYAVSFWVSYLDACRSLAREHRVHIRTLDKALWQYSKERGAEPAAR